MLAPMRKKIWQGSKCSGAKRTASHCGERAGDLVFDPAPPFWPVSERWGVVNRSRSPWPHRARAGMVAPGMVGVRWGSASVCNATIINDINMYRLIETKAIGSAHRGARPMSDRRDVRSRCQCRNVLATARRALGTPRFAFRASPPQSGIQIPHLPQRAAVRARAERWLAQSVNTGLRARAHRNSRLYPEITK